ncbi:DUF429 domain-containing protein [Pseudomonas cavernae]|uniref:DUF429 domain-containing protein n=1 Tax=Pseudomonas cavernae TaxID=2320867 RepID=A0A385YYV6_9PSED|nr:DUF429 domain-containing protein [Pseudomonas cavernae]AYC31510.1 DUF429 domain-containing protein [Pseudomonas cavernae]
MNSTFAGNPYADYLGADLTDRYAKGRRPIDVCGLHAQADGSLVAEFWHWEWDAPPAPLDVTALLPELAAARSAMLDGPQALANPGERMRQCERLCGAAGKTPDRPPVDLPFAGFVRSSVELFCALADADLPVSPDNFAGGVSEAYPGDAWKRLAPGLMNKAKPQGRQARKAILERLGVRNLPESPSHDHLDACLCALIAAAADGKVAGLAVRSLGAPLLRDSEGVWREGPMATLESIQPLALDS